MRIIKPNYYDSFRCLASACPDSCCKEWSVEVDPQAAAYYRQLPGPLGEHLRRFMAEENGDTVLTLTPEKRCPMWRDDGLCHIHAQLGEEHLCHTCRQFPRLQHDYGDFIELGLELSCPEAARLILSSSNDMLVTEVPGGDAPEYDTEAMSVLLQSRHKYLHFLNNDPFSVREALAVLLLYGYEVQEELDGGEPALLDPASLLDRARSLAAPGDIQAIIHFFQSLEILTGQWRSRLSEDTCVSLPEKLRPVINYFVMRYWLQAVSDYDLIGRLKLIIVSCLVIGSLGKDLASTAQLYSKEIENDANNIDALLDGAYTSPAMTDISLLGLLLEN